MYPSQFDTHTTHFKQLFLDRCHIYLDVIFCWNIENLDIITLDWHQSMYIVCMVAKLVHTTQVWYAARVCEMVMWSPAQTSRLSVLKISPTQKQNHRYHRNDLNLGVLHGNIDQTLVNSLHNLLNFEIGELDCRVITTKYISCVIK